MARVSLIGFLLTLAGCMVGPDYKPPATTMPAAWIGATPTTAPTTRGSMTTTAPAADVSSWWKTFNDPELETLVTRAIESNLDLKLAAARVRQARGSLRVIASGLWPQANVGASYVRQGSDGSRPVSSGAGGTVEVSTGASDFYQMGLDAAWEIDVFGGVRRGVEAAKADVVFAVEDQRDVMVTLTSEVALNYITLRGLQRQLVIARENLGTQEYSADLTRRRRAGGFVNGLDVATAEAQVASTKSFIPVLEQQAQQTIYNIALLLGAQPGVLLNELSLPKEIPPTPAEVPIGLPGELLKRRPDVRRAEAQLHAATARVGQATADLFPKFNITGSIGTSGPDASSLFNWNNGFWSIGPGVSYPIFSAGRIRGNIDIQNAVQEQAAIAYEQAVLTSLRDVESALIAYSREQQHRAALREAVTANQRAVDLATQLYTEGQTDFLNVLTAQRSLFASQDALVQSDRTVATNLVSLYKALGGGWEQN